MVNNKIYTLRNDILEISGEKGHQQSCCSVEGRTENGHLKLEKAYCYIGKKRV